MAESKKKSQPEQVEPVVVESEPVVIEIVNDKPTGSFGGLTKEEKEAE